MWCAVLVAVVLVAPSRGQAPATLAPPDDNILLLGSFGASVPDVSRLYVRDAEGVYVANHTATVRQWRHATRNSLLLTYEPLTAGPTELRRWLVLDLDRDKPLVELPAAGPAPWLRPAAGWRVRDCAGRLRRSVSLRLLAVTERRHQGSCSTLSWRLTGLSDRYTILAPLAGVYRATDRYAAGAPVYRTAAGADLRRVVQGARSSWVLTPNVAESVALAVLDDFADRVNWVRAEEFVAARLHGRDFRDRLAFECAPSDWASGDSDFQLPDRDGYRAASSQPEHFPWWRRPLTERDRRLYALAYGGEPPARAHAMVFQSNSTAYRESQLTNSDPPARVPQIILLPGSSAGDSPVVGRLESPPLRLAPDGCALLRLRNQGFRLTVALRHAGGERQLLQRSSISSWRDVVVPLATSGTLVLTVDQPATADARLALNQVLIFNETCDQLQGRTSACETATCLNGGTCVSVTLKHRLCHCRPGYVGERCQRRVDCGPPPDVAGGWVVHTSGSAYLDRAYYDCHPGHQLTDVVLALAWSTCHHDGTWANVPRCERAGPPGSPRPHIECRFDAPCEGFNTRVDNDYNVATDVAWRRADRLKTSQYKGKDHFLTIHKAEGRRTVTARILTPCLGLRETGCIKLDYFVTNATLKVLTWPSERALYEGSSTGEGGLNWATAWLPLAGPQLGPLLIVAQLSRNVSEAAVDTVRVYREQCTDVADEDDDPWPDPHPKWGPSQPTTTPDLSDVLPPSAAAAVHAGHLLTSLAAIGALLQR